MTPTVFFLIYQRKQFLGAFTGSASSKGAVAKCKIAGCSAGRVCLGGSWECGIPAGGKCKPGQDACQGQYYCSSSGICNGSGRGKAGASCKSSVDFENGFHCDQTTFKCNKVEGNAMCTKNSDCQSKCQSNECICARGSCLDLHPLGGAAP